MKKSVFFVLIGMFATASIVSADTSENITVLDDGADQNEVAFNSGVYFGLGVGGKFDETKGYIKNDTTNPDKGAALWGNIGKKSNSNVFGVVSLGYNHVFGNILAGIGAAYSIGEKKKSQVEVDNKNADNDAGTGNMDAGFRMEVKNNIPELYAKFGLIYQQKNLFYVKMGAAWLSAKCIDTSDDNWKIDGSKTKAVFKTGIGYERAFTKNISGFVEYSYTMNSKSTYDYSKEDGGYKYTSKFELKRRGAHSFAVGVNCNVAL